MDVFRAECVRSGLEARQHVKLFQYSGEILCQPDGGTQNQNSSKCKSENDDDGQQRPVSTFSEDCDRSKFILMFVSFAAITPMTN